MFSTIHPGPIANDRHAPAIRPLRVPADRAARRRELLREIGAGLCVIVVGTAIMAGLVALRLYFLMPATFHGFG